MTDEELLKKATKFYIWGVENSPSFNLCVELKSKDRSDGRHWAVTLGGGADYDYAVDGFVYGNPGPDDLRSRFTRDAALEHAEKLAARMQANHDNWIAGGRNGYFNAIAGITGGY